MNPQSNEIYNVIGLMSGTSLDGLDMCYCRFEFLPDNHWSYEIRAAESVSYSDSWRQSLKESMDISEEGLDSLSLDFGAFMGHKVKGFIKRHQLEKIDFIASHGHTVHHRPQEGVTIQIGDGRQMVSDLGIPIINDFRTLDVALGGQGAPLVPFVDKGLFSNYEACLNLGGIANISFDSSNQRLAFDVCPANLPLNKWVSQHSKELFDRGGEFARQGSLIPTVLEQLNQLPFYNQTGPKSLGVEWLEKYFYPNLEGDWFWKDVLRTVVEHETEQIARVCEQHQLKNTLVTGGGAYNTFFMERLQAKTSTNLVVPEPQLVEFKEALAFAFLGVMCFRNEVNTLASVTGAREDSCGGKIWNP